MNEETAAALDELANIWGTGRPEVIAELARAERGRTPGRTWLASGTIARDDLRPAEQAA